MYVVVFDCACWFAVLVLAGCLICITSDEVNRRSRFVVRLKRGQVESLQVCTVEVPYWPLVRQEAAVPSFGGVFAESL
ncbi:hypothetical protein [Synechococcus sp. CBW1108]|uniref:hypothetical protein n=1 Tax=Synechococcus sp. CBW1108 TaxID=1353147 RepID=UPI0018CE0AA6|nr:hypothetical protein [Synechococcus sp. CBW1108]QPN70028.1 hypothetical protein H8F27_16635 [Synechococcus sp. CBW1108]